MSDGDRRIAMSKKWCDEHGIEFEPYQYTKEGETSHVPDVVEDMKRSDGYKLLSRFAAKLLRGE